MQNNQPETGDLIDLQRYLSLLWQRLWLILLIGLLVGGLGCFISWQIPPTYETVTRLLVIEAAVNQPTDYSSVMANQSLTSTYADMLSNEAALEEVINRLGLSTNVTDLGKSIQVAPVRNTQLISITVQGDNPAQISKIANTLVAIFIQRIQEIQSIRYASSMDNLSKQLKEIDATLQEMRDKITSASPAEQERLEAQVVQYQQIHATLLTSYEQARLAQAQSTPNVIQVNQAQPPMEPVSPKIILNTLFATLAGGVLAAAALLIVDMQDDTIKTPEQVAHLLGLPVLGLIYSHKNGLLPITQEQPRSMDSEAFRTLRANIFYMHLSSPVQTLMVTSPSPQEGKTTISINLATVYAQNENEVILLDADMRRPAIHRRMELPNNFGVTSLLQHPGLQPGQLMRKTGIPGLFVIPSGDLPPNPAELLGSRKMGLLLNELKKLADLVVIDTPPILPVTDSLILAPQVDGVLLTLKPGVSKTETARLAVEQLRRVNARIIGVVFNNANKKSSRYKHQYDINYLRYIS